MQKARLGLMFALLALIVCAVGACAARPAPEAVFEKQIATVKGKHIINILTESDKVDYDSGVKYYLTFDHRKEEGDVFKYYFIAFYRCSGGAVHTTDVILTTDRQGVIQDIIFTPVDSDTSQPATAN
jgi:hydroxymethylpyrimidine pyrophosphatase-like HAD family hydrolase